jgi:hypothetical protein
LAALLNTLSPLMTYAIALAIGMEKRHSLRLLGLGCGLAGALLGRCPAGLAQLSEALFHMVPWRAWLWVCGDWPWDLGLGIWFDGGARADRHPYSLVASGLDWLARWTWVPEERSREVR